MRIVDRRGIPRWSAFLLCAVLAAAARAEAPTLREVGLRLARELSETELHAEAAVEYRRLALAEETPAHRGAFYWMAGYEYWRAGRSAQADRMLTLAEDATPELDTEIRLLRGENERARFRLREAAFYWEGTALSARSTEARQFAARRLAALRLELGDIEGARAALALDPAPTDAARAALDEYAQGSDKSLIVGGLLGLVPGLGYAYSGEYASAVRSLLMNALCIWGIVEFAEREQWAGVAVVGFAGLTFYSGSVYGGVDAAYRYNQRRLKRATLAIEGRTRFEPAPELLPTLSLRFYF